MILEWSKSKKWNGAWNKLQLNVCQIVRVKLAPLGKHKTFDPVMVRVVSPIPTQGNFLLRLFELLDINSGLIIKNSSAQLLHSFLDRSI